MLHIKNFHYLGMVHKSKRGQEMSCRGNIYKHGYQGKYYGNQYEKRLELYEKLDWLTVNQLVVYHTLITILKIRQSQQPEYLARSLSNDTLYGKIVIPNIKLSLAQKSFLIRGKSSWNQLPTSLRNQIKIRQLKKYFREWILQKIPRFLY